MCPSKHTRVSREPIIRLDWGRRGALRAAERGDVIVIVDVLSFSTSVTVAASRGAFIYPCRMEDDPGKIARQIGAVTAVGRKAVPKTGRFSLSPLTYLDIEPGQKVVVASPNGATCSDIAASVPYVFTAGLVNASAVAASVSRLIREHTISVTVIACGERESSIDDRSRIRWAVEDYLGAGAVLLQLDGSKSPDAIVCEGAFAQSRNRIIEILHGCQSGRELHDHGFGRDVDYAAQLNVLDCVPIIREGRFESFEETDR
jgi:2-phosphosulfolactate phosphatase